MLSKNNKLIVALDCKKLADSRRLVSELGSLVSFYKIGLRTFVTDGFNFASELKKKGKSIFLDLKLFDIQSTIEETVGKLSYLDIDFLTVHGDPSIVGAASKGNKNDSMKILAVTFLTNQNREDLDLSLIKGGDVQELVVERASNAISAGADGLISSPLEVPLLRTQKFMEGKLIVTPGIRPKNGINGDQKRIASPSEAVTAGADYIVVGRPIWQSTNPKIETKRILNDL